MAYNWDLIKREYVQGITDKNGKTLCPTLEDLCERHGCKFSTISKKSSSGNWKQERKLFGKKKESKIEERKIEVMAEESANIDNKALNISEKGLKEVNKRLCDKELSNHDLQKLSNTASIFHKMGKLALGEPTEHTQNTGKTEVEVSIHDRINKTTEYFQDIDTTPESGDK